LDKGILRKKEGSPSQKGCERQKLVKYTEGVMYNDYSVNVLNDNPTFKAGSSFMSSPTRQDGGQEAEIVSYFASLVRASVDNVAYFSPQPAQGVGQKNISHCGV
jgi:hypothetical protein